MPLDMSFENLLEANLEELVLAIENTPGATMTLEGLYGAAIIDFLRGDLTSLKNRLRLVTDRFFDHPERKTAAVAIELRVQIRTRIFESGTLKAAADLAASPSRWQGELLLLLATAHTVFNSYERALELFEQAAHSFAGQGCHRKSLRARLNVLVCESHLHPEKNLFARYHDLYRRALRSRPRELVVATTCLLNISREYQLIGSHQVALKYCDKALEHFESHMGDINYFLTLVHRAHLLLELGRKEEARVNYEAAKLCSFKEVHAALEVVAAALNGAPAAQLTEKDQLPTWQERTMAPGEAPKMSQLEQKLLRFLSDREREKIDVLEHLYGSLLPYEVKLNRFKSLVGTLRKKWPGLVLCEQGRYRLSDTLVGPLNSRSGTGA